MTLEEEVALRNEEKKRREQEEKRVAELQVQKKGIEGKEGRKRCFDVSFHVVDDCRKVSQRLVKCPQIGGHCC